MKITKLIEMNSNVDVITERMILFICINVRHFRVVV